MTADRTQLNITIDPKLLAKLKKEAIKNGMTLKEFVTLKLSEVEESSTNDVLEARLTKLERHLNLSQVVSTPEDNNESIFTDDGAERYGEIAKKLFDSHINKKNISRDEALKELAVILVELPNSYPELIFQILLGQHKLTGIEMTNAYRHGSCGMRTALVRWMNDPLEELNDAFLQAVTTKNLK